MQDVRSAFYGINFKFLRTQFPDFHAYREQKKINTQDVTFICCLLLFFSLTLCKTKQGALGSQELSNDVDSLLPPNNEDPGRKLPSE